MYFDTCTESHVHMVLNCLQAKMRKHMSWNARREWKKKRRRAHSAVLPCVCPTSIILCALVWNDRNKNIYMAA